MPSLSDLDPRQRYPSNRRLALALGSAALLSACGPGKSQEKKPTGPAPIPAPKAGVSVGPRPGSSPPATLKPEASPTVEPHFREVSIGKSFLLHNKDVGLTQGGMYVPVSYWTPERTFIRNSQGQVQQINEKTGVVEWTWADKKGMPMAANNNWLYLMDEETYRIYVFDAKTKEQSSFIPPERLPAQMLKLRYRWPAFAYENQLILSKSENPSGGGVNFGYGYYLAYGKELSSTPREDSIWVQDVLGDKLLYLYITNGGWYINSFDLKTGASTPDILVARRLQGTTYHPLFANTPSRLLSWAGGILQFTDLETGKLISQFPARQVPTKIYPPAKTSAGQEFAFYQTQEGFWAYPADPNSPAFRRVDSKPLFNGNGWIFEMNGTGVLRAFGSEYKHDAAPTWENAEVQAERFWGMSGGKLVFTNWDPETNKRPQSGVYRIYFLDSQTGKETKKEIAVDPAAKDLPKIVTREKSTFVVSKAIEKYDPQTARSEIVYSGSAPAKYVFDTGGERVNAEFPNKLVIFKAV